MKNRYTILISVLLPIALIIFVCFSINTSSRFLNSDSDIIFSDSDSNTIGIVTKNGNCYVKGNITAERNYGVENPPASLFRSDDFLKIYDKGNAKTINITSKGGTIITDSGEVYVFINDNKNYMLPVCFTTGYSQACVWDPSHIYLLSIDGDFGYVSIDSPDSFHLIKKNVRKFIIEGQTLEQGEVAFVLTNDNQLFVCPRDEEGSVGSVNGILDFDVLCPHTKLLIISLLDTEHRAYYCIGDYDLSFETLSDRSIYTECGSNIESVVSYSKGIAMLNSQNEVSIYGSDYKHNSSEADHVFKGEVVIEGALGVYGGDYNLIVSKETGGFEIYGRNSYDATYKLISSEDVKKSAVVPQPETAPLFISPYAGETFSPQNTSFELLTTNHQPPTTTTNYDAIYSHRF